MCASGFSQYYHSLNLARFVDKVAKTEIGKIILGLLNKTCLKSQILNENEF